MMGSNLTLLKARDVGRIRVRVTDCGEAEEESRFVFATTHPQLWFAVAMATARSGADPDRWADDAIQLLLEDEDPVAQERIVDAAVALYGLPWEKLTPAVAAMQLDAFEKAPDWMLEVPVPKLWRLRKGVFGRDLTRVAWALEALADAYVDEGPVPQAVFGAR